ncbi:hypothetical protein HDU84_003155 [Entophlyctis sp. JEL0112]|nr:hypothetical protein HDU84_003155 [Entophlyctis sp. JEL0112]
MTTNPVRPPLAVASPLPHQTSTDTLSSPSEMPHPQPSLRHPLWSALFAKLSQKSVIDHWKASLPALPSPTTSTTATARNSIVSALNRVESSSQVSHDVFAPSAQTQPPFESNSSIAGFELALLAQR